MSSPNTQNSPPTGPQNVPTLQRPRSRRWLWIAIGLTAILIYGVFGGFSALAVTLASRALASGDLSATRRWLDWSHRLGRDDAGTEMLEARLALRQNRTDDLRSHLLRAQRLGASTDLLQREQWLVMARTGQMLEAGQHLPELLTDPRNDGQDICEAYATGYLLTFQIPQARAVLDAWSGDYPNDAQPHLFRARIFLHEHNWKGAEAEFRKAQELAPANLEAILGLADVLASQRKPAEALEWYQRVPSDALQGVSAQIGAAECLVALGRSAEAQEILSQALSRHPEHPIVLRNLGRLELEAGHYERAVELLRKSQEQRPNDDETLYALAAALRGTGAAEEAQELTIRVRQIRHNDGEIGRLLAVLVQNPEDVEARYQIGMLQIDNRETQEGLMWLRSILQFQPDHAAAREAIRQHAPNGVEHEMSPESLDAQ